MDSGQRLVAIFSIFLTAVVLCGATGLVSYTYGQSQGYYAGYQAGQQASYSVSNEGGGNKIYQVGYQAGYEAGVKENGSDEYSTKNPSHQEMREFLAQDTTDSKAYMEWDYVCSDFAAEVNNNAEAHGIRCALVYISYTEGYGHTIVAFETRDRGLMFIEPQHDDEVDLVVGKGYAQLNGYNPSPRDDTIQRFRIIW